MAEDDAAPRAQEVVEERRERLEVLDLDRTPRPEKLARESALAEGAHEVLYEERAFMPRQPATIDQVRAAVDALAPRRVTFRDPRPPAPLPPAPPPSARPIPEHLRGPIELAAGRKVASVERVDRIAGADVVEATFEGEPASARALYTIQAGVAHPFEEISSRVDDLPEPQAPPPGPPPSRASPPAKRGLVGRLPFGKKKP